MSDETQPTVNSSTSLAPNEYEIESEDAIRVTTKREQLKYQGFYYNKHESYTLTDSYRCNKYSRLKCLARIKYNKSTLRYIHINKHNHLSEDHVFKTVVDLSEERKNEINNFIKENTHIDSAKTIRDILNSSLNEDEMEDPQLFIKIEDVQRIMRKFYSRSISCLQDLFVRPEISKKQNGEQFVR